MGIIAKLGNYIEARIFVQCLSRAGKKTVGIGMGPYRSRKALPKNMDKTVDYVEKNFGPFIVDNGLIVAVDGGITLRLSSVTSNAWGGARNLEMRDQHLKPLQKLQRLRELEIRSEYVTDKGLNYLHDLKDLKKLVLRCPFITSQGLEHLAGLTALHHLELTKRFNSIRKEDLIRWAKEKIPPLDTLILHEQVFHESELMRIDNWIYRDGAFQPMR
ncbi:MAG: hypothetical protein WCT39_05035 [Candidatus Margulisiibacteriota bacterium]